MKKFLIGFFVFLLVVYYYNWSLEKARADKLLQDAKQKEQLVINYCDSLPDAFLREFYPDVKNLDSLRQQFRNFEKK